MTVYPCIESTIDAVIDGYNVRLWISRDAIPNNLRREQEIHNRIVRFTGYQIPSLIKKIIGVVPNLNAIQVRDGIVGTVVYTVDFGDKDPHG